MSVSLFMIELKVADFARSLAWYRSCFAWPVHLLDESNQFVILDAGNCKIALKSGAPVPGSTKLVSQVEDLRAEVKRLESLGVTFDNPICWNPEGYRFASLRDPDGYRLELFEWASAGRDV